MKRHDPNGIPWYLFSEVLQISSVDGICLVSTILSYFNCTPSRVYCFSYNFFFHPATLITKEA